MSRQRQGLWWVVALVGLLVFLARGMHYALTQRVLFDEGLYLFKGWLMVQGAYRPFEPYGPWSNRMPLSLLIYGLAQRVGGTGLWTGRMFSLAMATVGVMALWDLARRWTDARRAAWVPWAAAASAVALQAYSMALSQSLAFGLSALVVALALGPEEPRGGRLALAGGLAGALVTTRLNMFPVLFLLGGYLTWRWGRRSWTFWLPGLLVAGGVHALYWPDILTLWVKWLPRTWTPFLDPWRPPIGGEPVWRPSYDWTSRVDEVFQVARYFLLAWVALALGGAASLREALRRGRLFPQSALVGLLVGMWVLHFWATVAHPTNVRALSFYAAFFGLLALPLAPWALARAGRAWRTPLAWPAWVLPLFAPVLVMVTQPMVLREGRVWLGLRVRRLLGEAGYRWLREGVLGWLPEPWRGPGVGLLLLGIGGVMVLLVAWRVRGRIPRLAWSSIQAWWAGLLVLTALGVLMPGLVGNLGYLCPQGRPIERVTWVARQLAGWVRPGDQVFGMYGERLLVLLEPGFPAVQTFPQQYNNIYNFRRGGSPEVLARWGYWNEILARRWLQRADVWLGSSAERTRWSLGPAWRLVGITAGLNPCDEISTRLWVYRREGHGAP